MTEERAALQLDNDDVVVGETHREAWREDKIAGNHDERVNARVVTLEAVLVGRDKVTKVGEEVVCPLRVPELIGIIESLDLSHVNEDGRRSIVSVFRPFEEQGIALVVDWPMASGREALVYVGKGETAGATCGGSEAERGIVAVLSEGLADEPKWVRHRSGKVYVGKVVHLAD